MAKEDFCFVYYDGDAARDKAHMSRLERGAYDDLISAQRKRGHLSLDDIKKVLSKDFEECWPSLQWVLKIDAEQKYFIEWVDKSLEKMRSHSKKQKEKADKRWHESGNTETMPRHNQGIHSAVPLEDENGIEDEINVLIQENQEQRFSSNELADYFSKWLNKLIIPNEREYSIKNLDDRGCRFDLMVFDTDGNPFVIIEVKNYSKHDDYYKPLKQIARYSEFGLPILFVPNFRMAYQCLMSCCNYYAHRIADNNFVFVPHVNSQWIVPAMMEQFKQINPQYPDDEETDFPQLKKLAEKIHKGLSLKGLFTDRINGEKIKLRWGELIDHIKADQHFSGYSLSQINKYYQSIVQSESNGRSKADKQAPPTKLGTSEARTEALKNWSITGGEQVP